MSQYLCEECGVLTHLKRHLDKAENLPKADECPNCGEVENFVYL
jgi:ssDNA-binding Zn-finger/Zn-ribbon topoisomerase 1